MKEKLKHKRLSHISQMQLRIYIVTCCDPVNCVAAGHALQTGRAQKHWYLRGFVAIDPQPRQGLRPRLKTGGAENTGIYGVL